MNLHFLVFSEQILVTVASPSMIRAKKKPVPSDHSQQHFENVKPIEVKCFFDDQTIKLETIEKKTADGTATMTTVIPTRAKRPASGPSKPQTPSATPITNLVTSKPIRHVAILPSAKDPPNKSRLKEPSNLSETFTLYEGPKTTPTLGRSLDDATTLTTADDTMDKPPAICDIPEISLDQTDVTCELVEHAKLFQKPHSLIGRHAPVRMTKEETSAIPSNPVVHIATVQYSDPVLPDPNAKQMLIQQFYAQLEQMKAVFSAELNPKFTTNTLTFDHGGQVQQIINSEELKEKPNAVRAAPVTDNKITKKVVAAPVQQQRHVRKTSCPRIHSAPISMSTRTTGNTFLPRRIEKRVNPPRRSVSTAAKKKNRSGSAPPPASSSSKSSVISDFRPTEVTLLPQDEEECRKIYEKLQRLQPDGVCVDMNTLRRALYPPIGTTTYSASGSAPSVRPLRSRIDEIPQSWIKDGDRYISPYVPQSVGSPDSKFVIASDQNNIDRIAEQMKKHAAINYSYYTRTK